jgi:hypothetical protein
LVRTARRRKRRLDLNKLAELYLNIDGELESGEVTFYGHSEHDQTQPPDMARRFAFHPSMIDYLGESHVQAVGEPVYPEPQFLEALGVS